MLYSPLTAQFQFCLLWSATSCGFLLQTPALISVSSVKLIAIDSSDCPNNRWVLPPAFAHSVRLHLLMSMQDTYLQGVFKGTNSNEMSLSQLALHLLAVIIYTSLLSSLNAGGGCRGIKSHYHTSFIISLLVSWSLAFGSQWHSLSAVSQVWPGRKDQVALLCTHNRK